MSYETLYPGAANLIGNVALTRNINPTVRASIRRNDPDFLSSAPYYPNVAGKTLKINYTKEVASVVTSANVSVVLSGTSLSGIIADINVADSVNIRAFDIDGFLAIQNLNPGKTHLLTIAPFTTPANDAAPFLGFEVDPFPGSTSFAGELTPTPGSRTQLNPQTTALLSGDDSLRSEVVNRGFFSILQLLEDLRAELSRDVVVYKEVLLSFAAHNPGPVPAARINDDSIRLFYPFPDSDPPAALNPSDLTPFFRALDSSGAGEDVVNFGSGTTNANALQVTNLFYATNLTNFNSSAAFATWGTPDGGTLVSSATANKTKHPSASITSIKGNIVFCSSATFVSHKVKAGDPVKFTASVLQPFDHSGWFAIDAVIDETHLAIRPMASSEEIPDGTSIRPRWLNPLAGGTLLVAVGRFIPAGDIYVTINSSLTTVTQVVRLPVGAKFIDTLNADRARDLSGNLGRIGAVLQDHLNSSPDRHPASSITGFTSTTTWRDGTTITGANLQQTIEDILTDLKAQATGNSGTGRLGAEVITVTGGAPNTLAQGTILTQLTALLQAIHDHVVLTTGAHAATAISYAGGGNWADGTTNPSTTVEGQLDKIITDLGGTGGASKVKYDGGGSWLDGTTNPATTVEGQLDKIITDLGGSGGASKIGFAGSGNWSDGTTNPATSLESQLDKIVSDLAPSTGSAKIGGAASGTDIAANNVGAQIADLAVNWMKMSRANTIGGAQTFSSLITANAGLTAGANQNITISGTGVYKHGLYTISRTILSNGANFGLTDRTSNNIPVLGLTMAVTGGGNDIFAHVRIPEIPTNARIVNVTVTFDSAANRNVCTGQVRKIGGGDPAVITATNVGGAMSSTGIARLTVTGLNVQPALGEMYWAQITNTSASITPTVINIILDFDVP